MDEKREPLLSDSQRSYIISKHVWKPDLFIKAQKLVDEICDFYESKITFGELRVVREVEINSRNQMYAYDYCEGCKWSCIPSHYRYCPGCGAKIKTQD